ncbi:hypothetical protein F5887DRAFT_1204278 [Amanita rubescens]|nr:hypothetical protein F5887DRAFT_1204278 [Amanita rubescens]
MLFLQALLFFMFGISVVAIPTSPMISDISRRGPKESKGKTPPSSPHTGHKKPDLDGLWKNNDPDEYPSDSYMKITEGTIIAIWPPIRYTGRQSPERRLQEKEWNRETNPSKTRISTFLEGSFHTEFMDQVSIDIEFGPEKLKMTLPIRKSKKTLGVAPNPALRGTKDELQLVTVAPGSLSYQLGSAINKVNPFICTLKTGEFSHSPSPSVTSRGSPSVLSDGFDLYRGDLSAMPNDPPVDYDSISLAEAYYYIPEGDYHLIDHNTMNDRITSSVQMPSSLHFRHDVMERDGPVCVFTGLLAVHAMQHTYSPKARAMSTLRLFSKIQESHSLFALGSSAFLKTPNFALGPADIPRVETDPMPPSRITLYQLEPDPSLDPILQHDARIASTGIIPPPSTVILDFTYGVAAYRRWGSGQDIKEPLRTQVTAIVPQNLMTSTTNRRRRGRNHGSKRTDGMLRAMDDVLMLSMLLKGTTPELMATERQKREEAEELCAQEASRAKVQQWMQSSPFCYEYNYYLVPAVPGGAASFVQGCVQRSCLRGTVTSVKIPGVTGISARMRRQWTLHLQAKKLLVAYGTCAQKSRSSTAFSSFVLSTFSTIKLFFTASNLSPTHSLDPFLSLRPHFLSLQLASRTIPPHRSRHSFSLPRPRKRLSSSPPRDIRMESLQKRLNKKVGRPYPVIAIAASSNAWYEGSVVGTVGFKDVEKGGKIEGRGASPSRIVLLLLKLAYNGDQGLELRRKVGKLRTARGQKTSQILCPRHAKYRWPQAR